MQSLRLLLSPRKIKRLKVSELPEMPEKNEQIVNMCFIRELSAPSRLKAGSLDSFLSDYICCVFSGIGWRAEVHPRTHPVNELEFDVIIGADGRRNTLPGKSACTDLEKCVSNAVFS